MKQMLMISMIVLALAGCRRADVRDFTVALPTATAADVPALRAALAPYMGVKHDTISFDAAKHELTLKYDSMQLAHKNIEMSLAQAGFTANGVTPESVGAKAIR